MRYKKFIIRNYRAIEGPLEIDVERKTLIPIIGVNESGKTTILHALFAFDCFNDDLNDGGRHLKDTSNLYRTSSPEATVEAIVEVGRKELHEALSDCEARGEKLKSEAAEIRKRRKLPEELCIRRNLTTRKYSLDSAKLGSEELQDSLAHELIRGLPYILFFDDFRDKVEERIEIPSNGQASGWLSIIEQLFKCTDKSLSVFELPKLEERKRKTILAKVQRRLNETLTREWQNFRLDDQDALEISIDFHDEASRLFGSSVAERCLRILPAKPENQKRIIQDLFDGADLSMIRSKLELPPDCSFERTIHALFYSPRKTELVHRIGAVTRGNFEELFTALTLG